MIRRYSRGLFQQDRSKPVMLRTRKCFPVCPRKLTCATGCRTSDSAKTGCEQWQRGSLLFDDLIGATEQRERNSEAGRPGGTEVDHQLDLRCLLHRKIGRLLALANSADVACGAPIGSIESAPYEINPPATPKKRSP